MIKQKNTAKPRLEVLVVISLAIAAVIFTAPKAISAQATSSPAPASEQKPVPQTEPQAAVSPPSAPAPAKPKELTPSEPNSDEEWIARIAKENDLFAIHDMQEQYEQRPEKSDAVIAALLKRRDELVAQHKPVTAIEGSLDFVECEFTKNEDGNNLLRWYFVVNKDIVDDWIFNPTLRVDKAHIQALPPDKRQAGGLSEAVFTNASKQPWKKGQHKLLSLNIKLEAVPYKIESRFYRWLPDKNRIFTDKMDHGWYAALDE